MLQEIGVFGRGLRIRHVDGVSYYKCLKNIVIKEIVRGEHGWENLVEKMLGIGQEIGGGEER